MDGRPNREGLLPARKRGRRPKPRSPSRRCLNSAPAASRAALHRRDPPKLRAEPPSGVLAIGRRLLFAVTGPVAAAIRRRLLSTVARFTIEPEAFGERAFREEAAGLLVLTLAQAALEALMGELPALTLRVRSLTFIGALGFALLEDFLGAGATLFGLDAVEQAAFHPLLDVQEAAIDAVRFGTALTVAEAALEQVFPAELAVLRINPLFDAAFDEVAHVQITVAGAGIDGLVVFGLAAALIETGVEQLGGVHLATLAFDALGEVGLESLACTDFTAVTTIDGCLALGEATAGDPFGDETAGVFAAPVLETASEGQGAGFTTVVVTEKIARTDAVLGTGVQEATRANAAGFLVFAAEQAAIEEFGSGVAAVFATKDDLVLADVEQTEGFVTTSLLVEILFETEFQGLVSATLAGIG